MSDVSACLSVHAFTRGLAGQLAMYMLVPRSGCGIERSDASKNGRRRQRRRMATTGWIGP
eukprot:7695634-Pyramimonas_sp.AAC.1